MERPFRSSLIAQLRDFAAKFVVLALAAIIVLLAFPFEPKISFGTLLLVCATTALFYWSKKSARPSYWVVASLFLAVAALAWACVAPVLFVSRPVYFFVNDEALSTDDLLKGIIPITKIAKISESADAGTLILLSDPVRRWFVPYFLNKFVSDRSIELHQESYANKIYIVFPLRLANRFTSGPERATYESMIFISQQIDVTLDNKGKLLHASEGFGPGITTFLNFSPSTRPEDAPWNAVGVTDPKAIKALRFVALLDEALEFAAYGDREAMTRLLIEAAGLAPSSTEKARVYCVLSAYYQLVLQGSLGKLQSISFANSAFQQLNRPDLAQNPSWMERWLARDLKRRYEIFGQLYSPRISTLKTASLAEPNDDPHLHLPGLLSSISRNQGRLPHAVIAALQDVQDENAAMGTIDRERSRLLTVPLSELKDELLHAPSPEAKALIIDLAIPREEAILNFLADKASNVSGRLEILEAAARSLPPRYSELYLKQISFCRAAIGLFGVKNSRNPVDLGMQMQKLMDLFPDFHSRYGSKYAEIVLSAMSKGEEPRVAHVWAPPADQDWWGRDFVSWEYYEILKWGYRSKEIHGPDFHGPYLYRDFALQVDEPMTFFVTDRTGGVFLPSMVIAALATDDEDSQEHRYFVRRLEKTLEVSYLDIKQYLPTQRK
ncbi:hypothetical protein [Burkholderia ubonensis]|uniref:hypothetical protein n=1 Tax=Burkholderia ubonensis TaxID=101571 RepID=UPI000A8791DE|nr:hypothetical protein [Burkholderia ubonensis]